MIIGIDGNEANVKNRVGVGQYTFNILKTIKKLDQVNKYIIYLKNQPRPDLPKSSPNWHYQVFGPQKLWTKFGLPLNLFLTNSKPDIFLSLGHYTPLFSLCPTVPCIMDLGYLKYPSQFQKKDLYQLTSWTKSSLKKAKLIITISEFSKTEIIKTYNIHSNKIFIAPPASNPLKTSISQDKLTLQKYAITSPYFLCLGTLKPNKNIPFLLQSFSLFSKKFPHYQLVIAGKKGWLYQDIFAVIKKLKLENKVIFTDYFNEKEKWSLYRKAHALVIPSIYEGFGMPALEAMSVGTPVIASNTSSLPEVVGHAGLLIDPQNTPSLSNALVKITNLSTRNKLSKLSLTQAQKYSWSKSAQIIINQLTQLS